MKAKYIFLTLLIFTSFVLLAVKPKDDKPRPKGRIQMNPHGINAVSSIQLDANQISTWFRTNGSYNRDPATGNAGFVWPKGSGKTARYASGMWIAAKVGPDTLVSVAEYSYDYQPGFVDASGNYAGINDPAYKIYKLKAGDGPGVSDYDNWPVNQGAYTDSATGKPLIMGEQTMFYSYTDGDRGWSGASAPGLKAEIHQTNWAYNLNGPLGNITFTEFAVINKSGITWENAYLACWTDDDLGSGTDDNIGCDSTRKLGYTFNGTNNDGIYGSAPPAVGTTFFQGPIVPGLPTDTAFYFKRGYEQRFVKLGYKKLGLFAFNTYNNTSPQPSDPQTTKEAYNVIIGKWRTGEDWTVPGTSQITRYVFSGDPVTHTGWYDNRTPTDTRTIQTTGPFNMNANDTQYVIVAQVIARAGSNLQSITALRATSDLAQRIFDNNFKVPPPPPSPNVSYFAPGNGKIYLSWEDNAERTWSYPNKLSGGTYTFQGYNIYAIKPGTVGFNTTDRKLLATFDRIDGITDIQDSIFAPEYGNIIVYTTVQKGSDNGISRSYIVDLDNYNNTPLVNGTQYRFAVTSYFYDPIGGVFSASKVSESSIGATSITYVTPQSISPTVQLFYGIGDTIRTNQSDKSVLPIVFKPFDLVNANYTSVFGGTKANLTYTLLKNGTIVLQDIPDFTGLQDTAKVIDGLMLIHKRVLDSGVVKDINDPFAPTKDLQNWNSGVTYSPANNVWLRGVDTTIITTQSKLPFFGKQFQSRGFSVSHPTTATFRGSKTTIFANGDSLVNVNTANNFYGGGPLKKIAIKFGQNSSAYRYCRTTDNGVTWVNIVSDPASDTVFTGTIKFADIVTVPFSVYNVDELDDPNTAYGQGKQLNFAFIDADANGQWDPDTTKLGKLQISFILSSPYNVDPTSAAYNYYKLKNLASAAPSGFPSMDIMYAWVPRVINRNGAPLTFTANDNLIITPYRPTRPFFVPNYHVMYSWNVTGTNTSKQLTTNDLDKIKAYPNPYYGFQRLESSPVDKFIVFSHLPPKCTLYIYTLDGLLVRKLERNESSISNTEMRWDLQNASQITIASGMYIVYIDVPGVGNKILKIAIFTPEERIQVF